MTQARRNLVDPNVTRWYHCISRCIRRAHLLGGTGLEHRQEWLHERHEYLSNIFAITVAGFSILENHLHTLIRLDPERARSWTAYEVARRWGTLCPPRKPRRKAQGLTEEWIKKKARDHAWVDKMRERLSNLGWFMKCLKEPLARMANAEDGFEGPLFAGRYKSIAILDEESLLRDCAYIDLNPLAAGIAFLPEESRHTSIDDRVAHVRPKLTRADFLAVLAGMTTPDLPGADAEQDHWLCPMEDRRAFGAEREGLLEAWSFPRYLLLLDHSARLFRDGKGRLAAEVAPIFERLGTTMESWEEGLRELQATMSSGKLIGRVLARSQDVLEQAAEKLGVRRLVNLTGRTPTRPTLPCSSTAPPG